MNKAASNKKSFKYRLIVSFCLISIIPIILMNIFSYYNTSQIVQNNVDELNETNLQKTDDNLNLVLESYEDLLYQLYTDDNIVKLVDEINSNENLAVARKQLRRTLRGLASIKPYIQCITIIAESEEVVFYDKLATSTTNIQWVNNYDMTTSDLYQQISSDNQTHILPTKYATHFSAEPYYLFHLAHRIIDYKKISKKTGVIILSIDEKILKEICNPSDKETPTNHNIILNQEGQIISYKESSQIGKTVVNMLSPIDQQDNFLIQLIKEDSLLKGDYLKIYRRYDEKLGWYLINISDQSSVKIQMSNQQQIMIFIIILSVIILITIIVFTTERLTKSIGTIVSAMKEVGLGNSSVRVEVDRHMPKEIETIASQFNHMIVRLNDSIEKEKSASIKQKNAEIAALEAQINPHFLYNTLDTINWMAIDRDEFEISNSISSLAKILRYGVDKSNSIVTLREEVEWLKQYIFLQQTRLKNTFECKISIPPELLLYRIHKLLLQPFIENAIIHGFEGVTETHKLEITITDEQDYLLIIISDNGKGIPENIVNQINLSNSNEDEFNHIGMMNAIGRLHMYYGDNATIKVESELGLGTSILITIPKNM